MYPRHCISIVKKKFPIEPTKSLLIFGCHKDFLLISDTKMTTKDAKSFLILLMIINIVVIESSKPRNITDCRFDRTHRKILEVRCTVLVDVGSTVDQLVSVS